MSLPPTGWLFGTFLTGNIISRGWMRGDTLDYAFCRAGAIGTRVTLLHEWIRLKSSAVCQISKPERTATDSLSLHIRGYGAFSASATKSRGAWENGNSMRLLSKNSWDYYCIDDNDDDDDDFALRLRMASDLHFLYITSHYLYIDTYI